MYVAKSNKMDKDYDIISRFYAGVILRKNILNCTYAYSFVCGLFQTATQISVLLVEES